METKSVASIVAFSSSESKKDFFSDLKTLSPLHYLHCTLNLRLILYLLTLHFINLNNNNNNLCSKYSG